MSSDRKFFLAARREMNKDETSLVLVDPWTGERHLMSESVLRDNYKIELGNWVHASVDPMKVLYNISKTEHTGRLWTNVEGNVAKVENLLTHLNSVQGELLFQCKLFGDALCTNRSLPTGEYKIKIHLCEKPVNVSGRLVHFEASDPEPKVQKQIIGGGFAVAPKREDKIVGAGFSSAPKKEEPVKMRAVVLSSVEKPIGTHYYLWNVDSKTESLFVSKQHKLEQGHFFEGSFLRRPDGRMTCQKYEKAIDQLFSGGLVANNKIYFTVKIDKYQPASGNAKRATAKAKYFGDVLEGDSSETKLSPECNGKEVDIQRRGLGGKEFVWMVTKIR